MNIHTFRVNSPIGFVRPFDEMEKWIDPEALSLIVNAYGGNTALCAHHAEEALYEAVSAIYDGRDEEANEALPEGFVWIRFKEPTSEGIGIIVKGVIPLEDAEANVALERDEGRKRLLEARRNESVEDINDKAFAEPIDRNIYA